MSFWEALADSAGRWPREPFLSGPLGGELDRATLVARARRAIAALRAWGVTPGDRVAVLAAASADVVVLQWALAGVGAIQVPINTALRGPLLADILRDTRPCLVAADPQQYAKLVDAGDDAIRDLPVLLLGEGPADLPAPAHRWQEVADFTEGDAAPRAPHDPLVIMFTSGTTGRSKGVVLSHRWAVDYCARATQAMGIDAGDRHHGFLPLFHIAGQYAQVGAAALCGASVALCPPFRAADFWGEVLRWRCTSAVLMASMTGVLRHGDMPEGSCLRKLHLIPMPPDFRELARRLRCTVTTNYGSTEASIPLMNRRPGDHRSCGVLCEGYEARIADAWDEELPDGTPGELLLRPSRPWTVITEYWNRPEATSAAWRNGWLHTGDVFVRRADGHFEFVDRAKDAIRRKGENISSYEVEMLACLHAQVEEAAAIAIDTADQDQELAVIYSCKAGQVLPEPALLQHLEAVAPRFMLPRYLQRVPALPRTETGKVQKAQLRTAPPGAFWDRKAP